MSWLKLSKAGTRFSRVDVLPFHGSSKRCAVRLVCMLLGAAFLVAWYVVVHSSRVRRFSLVGREDFHGSSDALLAAHYTGYGVWMEEVYNFMN